MGTLDNITSPMSRHFADGWKWGCRTALLLALGREADGGQPFAHPEQLPPEFVEWAEHALAKLDEF